VTSPLDPSKPTQLYDVVAVDLKTKAVRVMDRNLTLENAEAYVSMAVMRRGVDEEFFKAVPAGTEP
jgi:hypothetical protein